MSAITKDMTFGELIEKFPNAVGVLGKYGLHCIGCHIAVFETIEQGAGAHGISGKKLEEMLDELNKAK